MTTATFTFPTYRLAKILRQPGGKSVAAALKDAEEGVAGLVEPCLAAIDVAMKAIDGHLASMTAGSTAAAADRLYKEANGIIGLASAAGLPEMDRAAYSLCDLLDRMQAAGRWDRSAIVVHVQALYLLRQPSALGSDGSVRLVLLGLKKVREKLFLAEDVKASNTDPAPGR